MIVPIYVGTHIFVRNLSLSLFSLTQKTQLRSVKYSARAKSNSSNCGGLITFSHVQSVLHIIYSTKINMYTHYTQYDSKSLFFFFILIQRCDDNVNIYMIAYYQFRLAVVRRQLNMMHIRKYMRYAQKFRMRMTNEFQYTII